ncbi:MAG: secretin N-terminal domain-containing protein [Magnetococcus sp. THC-1_WYH]
MCTDRVKPDRLLGINLPVIGLVTLLFLLLSASSPADPQGGEVLEIPESILETDNSIPDLAHSSTFLMPQSSAAPLATYSVSVTDTPVREVLFALARDADLDVDIYPGVEGKITLNAANQTLPAILSRISEYAGLKYRITQDFITIAPDLPFRRNYKLDYILNNRQFESKMSATTNMASSSSKVAGNNSTISLATKSDVDFWGNILENLDAILGTAAEGEGKRVVLNSATGNFSILATSRQHREVQSFFDQIIRDAQRQVFIEAAIVEVRLSDRFQAGVDWNLLMNDNTTDRGNRQNMLNQELNSDPALSLTMHQGEVPFLTGVMKNADITATVRLLSRFGDSKVLSNPRLTVMNNQTAVLRVTENVVYFEVEVTPPTVSNVAGETINASNLISLSRKETKMRIAPIGIILQVTPQISEGDVISLNVHPTIQRISEWVDNPDPNMRPDNPNGESFTPPKVPVVKVQEMDSTLRVISGQLAIMGGLMENNFSKNMDSIPVLGSLPLIGQLFSYRNNQQEKKELVIFLRPVTISDANDMDRVASKDLYTTRTKGIDKDWSELGVGNP